MRTTSARLHAVYLRGLLLLAATAALMLADSLAPARIGADRQAPAIGAPRHPA